MSAVPRSRRNGKEAVRNAGRALQDALDPKRLEILDILKDEKEISVNRLAERLEIPKANTSQHLAVLRQAGVVTTRKDGINVYYSLRSRRSPRRAA